MHTPGVNYPEFVELRRDVEAVAIPDDTLMRLPKGAPVRIHQSLGGSYTVTTKRGYCTAVEREVRERLAKEERAAETKRRAAK